jgi:hypothetical protein
MEEGLWREEKARVEKEKKEGSPGLVGQSFWRDERRADGRNDESSNHGQVGSACVQRLCAMQHSACGYLDPYGITNRCLLERRTVSTSFSSNLLPAPVAYLGTDSPTVYLQQSPPSVHIPPSNLDGPGWGLWFALAVWVVARLIVPPRGKKCPTPPSARKLCR